MIGSNSDHSSFRLVQISFLGSWVTRSNKLVNDQCHFGRLPVYQRKYINKKFDFLFHFSKFACDGVYASMRLFRYNLASVSRVGRGGHCIQCCSVIVRAMVVLKRTVVGDSD